MIDIKQLKLQDVKTIAQKAFKDFSVGDTSSLDEYIQSMDKSQNKQLSDVFMAEFKYQWSILQFKHLVEKREFFEIDKLSSKNELAWIYLWEEKIDKELNSVKNKNPGNLELKAIEKSVLILKDLIEQTQDITSERFEKIYNEQYDLIKTRHPNAQIISVVFFTALALSYNDVLDSSKRSEILDSIYESYIKNDLKSIRFDDMTRDYIKIHRLMLSPSQDKVQEGMIKFDSIKKILENFCQLDENRISFTVFLAKHFGIENLRQSVKAEVSNSYIPNIEDILVNGVVIKDRFDKLNEKIGNKEENAPVKRISHKI